jgi:hypothetical protein
MMRDDVGVPAIATQRRQIRDGRLRAR